MPIAGAAAGAAQGLEELVAQRLMEQKFAEQIRAQQEQERLQTATLNQRSIEADDDRKYRQSQVDRQAKQDRDASNQRDVVRMMGEKIVQGNGELNDDDRRGLAGLAIEAGEDPSKYLTKPKPERDPISDHEAKARIDAKYRPRPQGSAGPRTPQWVRMDDGTVKDINGIAPPGSKPYDAVAERSSKPVNEAEAIDTANEAKRLASALVGHKGFDGAFGLAGSYMPTVRPDTADAEQLLGSLQSMLTMENMGKMKGVLSDADMKVLRQASTTLSNRMSDGAARAELNRIIDVMGRVSAGAPTGAPAPTGGSKFTIVSKQ